MIQPLNRYKSSCKMRKTTIKNSIWEKLALLYQYNYDFFGEMNSLIEMAERLESTSEAAVSTTSSRLNLLLKTGKLDKSNDEKIAIVKRTIHLIKSRIDSGRINNLDDKTQLAWICICIFLI